MNKINDNACMNQILYSKPECQILNFRTEGLLCMSAHTFAAHTFAADDISLEEPLGAGDFDQIF